MQRLPVLIKLREFVDDGRKYAYNLEQFLGQLWRLSIADIELVLNRGLALVLLDGLDEVTGEAGKQIAKEIKRFARAYPQVQVVVTCRTQSQESRFERFDYVEVANFNEEQVRVFAAHWFRTVCADAGETKAREFLEQLFREENKAIRELAITPILLSLSCAVFQQTGKFYSKRSKLYEEGLELLLVQWNKSRSVERDEIYRDLSVERKLELLTYVAVKKFEQEQYVLFEQEELEEYIGEFLGIERRESRGFLQAIASQHGLLIERAQKVWSFSHLTFQEYLVAKWFCDCGNLEGLASHLMQENWYEILILATEILPSADDFLKQLKEKIDRLEHINNDLLIENFLSWLNNKVLLVSIEAPATPPLTALRAFYFETLFGREWLGRDWQYKSLAFHLGLESIWIGSVWEFDRNLIVHFWEGAKFTIGNIHENFSQSVLDYLDRFQTNIYQYAAFDLELRTVLEKLRDCLPNCNMDLEAHYQWWQTEGQNWLGSLAIAILKKRNINVVFSTKLCEQQKEALKTYYKVNWTLVGCLKSNCIVTDRVRKEIQETLLLPITKIQN